MKMMFHIDDFKCTLCANWFCPPFNLPYLLPCTHSICTSCLQKASANDHIICPEDLEACSIQSININLTTKKALQRLMKEHKNYSENTQLECIKSLSLSFDQLLSTKQKQLRNLQILISQIFQSQIQHLHNLHQKIKTQLHRPYRIVQDWKQIVANHLTNLRKTHAYNNTNCNTNTNSNSNSNTSTELRSNSMLQLNHYIEEGRKIKMEVSQFFMLEFDRFADGVMRYPRSCFEKDFCVGGQMLEKFAKMGKKSGEMSHQKEQNVHLTEPKTKNSYDKQHIQTTTAVQNPHNSNRAQKNLQVLGSIDMNRMDQTNQPSNVQEQSILETKRGRNKQKNQSKSKRNSIKQENCGLDKFVLKEGQKNRNSVEKERKSVDKRIQQKLLNSPQKVEKKLTKKPKDTKQNIQKQDPKLCFNENLIQSNHQSFTLSQFQLETLTNQPQPRKKPKTTLTIPQPYPSNNTSQHNSSSSHSWNPNPNPNHNISNQTYKQMSPNSKLNTSQNQRLNKLVHLLDGVSINHSLANSGRNSLRRSVVHDGNGKILCTQNQQQSSLQNGSLLMSPNTICEQYTEQAQQSTPYQQQQLLDQATGTTKPHPHRPTINFLQIWQTKPNTQTPQCLQIRQNHYYYNCQKQKLSYLRKLQHHRVQQALKSTIIRDNFIQLINQSLHDVDMNLYLEQFDWQNSRIEIVKFVKTSLGDQQLNVLLNFLLYSKVKALVLSGNNLTDICLDALLNFMTVNSTLKNVYLPKNYVNMLRNKAKIQLLKEKGVNIYI